LVSAFRAWPQRVSSHIFVDDTKERDYVLVVLQV